MMNVEQHVRMARILSAPLRLEILALLMGGEATVAEIVEATGATQPSVSNDLSTLRNEGFVRGERAGRQIRYRLSRPEVAQLVEALSALTRPHDGRPPPASPLAEARSCYDHLAGRLGVEVLAALERERALVPGGAGNGIDLGPRAGEFFSALGVDTARAARAKRRFAFACVDWTERRAHLGGALGAAVLDRMLEAGWVARHRGTRALLVTSTGWRALRRTLGVVR